MPPPTLSRLTFETGARLKGGFKGRWAAERVISDTTLSLLKPASYAGTFSRDFVSRLRHRAGIVRRETRREGCVRDKQEAQKPTIAPGSGFKPPHYRLDGKRTTDSPRARSGRLHSLVLAAPAQRGREVVPAKATCGWFWCYLLPPKGSYTPRHSPRFCLFGRAKKRTREQRVFAPVRMFAENRAQNRTESGPKLPAAMRAPVLNRAQNRTESGLKLPAAMQTPVLNRAQNRTESGLKLPAAM